MKQTLFLGVATVLVAIGSFLASREHFYSAYTMFAAAIVMVIAAVWVTYRLDYRQKRGKEELGRILVELSQCQRAAYNGHTAPEYDKLIAEIEQIKKRVRDVAEEYFDCSIESRFLAVNVLDVQLDGATKQNFIGSDQGNFWPMYQQIQGWRVFLNDVLREIR